MVSNAPSPAAGTTGATGSGLGALITLKPFDGLAGAEDSAAGTSGTWVAGAAGADDWIGAKGSIGAEEGSGRSNSEARLIGVPWLTDGSEGSGTALNL